MQIDPGIIEYLREQLPGVEAIYQFGSTASGETHHGSDVDLAVLTSVPLSPVERWELQCTLASRLRRDVDLVDLRAASTVMRMQVVSTGVVLYAGPGQNRARFEMNVLSSYARLNEERRAILQTVTREGRVYGR